MVSKIPPDITAPTTSGISILNLEPINRAIGIIIENVPQLVPVEKDIIEDIQNIIRGKRVEGYINR